MLDYRKIGTFIADRRREMGLTQAEVAGKLQVSFQAVSKWENGTLPAVELLAGLAGLLQVSVDEILAGRREEEETLSYSKAGVDISYTDAMKREMRVYLTGDDSRVLNGMGAFASLYDIHFPEIPDPVLVLKSEEPGSKQKLAMEYGYSESICHDMINHLVNDIAVMGARPLAVLDTIVCGHAEKETVKSFIKGMADACRENECTLVGGETSIQPQVVEHGVYILTASVAGIVSRGRVIDGSAIREGDVLLAAASNGLHTNGYSLVRMLMDRTPRIKLEKTEGETFIEQIMRPHTSYYKAIRAALSGPGVHGMAHITGGGIAGNLSRIIPEGLTAGVDLSKIRMLPLFSLIQREGNITQEEMLSTFNCGVGLILVVSPERKDSITQRISRFCPCYEIGRISRGKEKIFFHNRLNTLSVSDVI